LSGALAIAVYQTYRRFSGSQGIRDVAFRKHLDVKKSRNSRRIARVLALQTKADLAITQKSQFDRANRDPMIPNPGSYLDHRGVKLSVLADNLDNVHAAPLN
jgi:ribosomal protein L35